jgi:glycosyltransferase involved in cell wall biosynthesis
MELRPRADYEVLLQRTQGTLVDADCTPSASGTVVRLLQQRGLQSASVAYHTLCAHRGGPIWAGGEDVGLPLGLLSQRYLRRPRIYMVTHGSYFGSARFRRLMRLLRYAGNVHYLCLSEALRSALIAEFGVPEHRAHNTGYAADTDYFQPSAREPDSGCIASAGAANRDFPTLVAASRGLPAQVTIACGSAWFPQAVEIGENLPPNVTARPHAYPELRALYARSAFVVVPLRPGKHACGYAVIADAMAAGRAVIVTRTAAASDFVVEGETGLYVRDGDHEDLRDKMRFLLTHPEEAQRMGRCARARMERHYSLDAYCRRMAQVMDLAEADQVETCVEPEEHCGKAARLPSAVMSEGRLGPSRRQAPE